MSVFRPDWAERIKRGRTKAYGRGWAKGYLLGFKEAKSLVTREITHNILNDAVLQMTADVDTIERVIEIVEASEN